MLLARRKCQLPGRAVLEGLAKVVEVACYDSLAANLDGQIVKHYRDCVGCGAKNDRVFGGLDGGQSLRDLFVDRFLDFIDSDDSQLGSAVAVLGVRRQNDPEPCVGRQCLGCFNSGGGVCACGADACHSRDYLAIDQLDLEHAFTADKRRVGVVVGDTGLEAQREAAFAIVVLAVIRHYSAFVDLDRVVYDIVNAGERITSVLQFDEVVDSVVVCVSVGRVCASGLLVLVGESVAVRIVIELRGVRVGRIIAAECRVKQVLVEVVETVVVIVCIDAVFVLASGLKIAEVIELPCVGYEVVVGINYGILAVPKDEPLMRESVIRIDGRAKHARGLRVAVRLAVPGDVPADLVLGRAAKVVEVAPEHNRAFGSDAEVVVPDVCVG